MRNRTQDHHGGCGDGTTASVEEDGRLLLLRRLSLLSPSPAQPFEAFVYKVHQESRDVETQLAALPMWSFCFFTFAPGPGLLSHLLTCQPKLRQLACNHDQRPYVSPCPLPNSLVLGFSRTPACSFNPKRLPHPFLRLQLSPDAPGPQISSSPGLKSRITGSLNLSLIPGTISARYLTPNPPLTTYCPSFQMIMKPPSSLVPKL